MKAKDILELIRSYGCPSYYDNSGSRSRDGRPFCLWCDDPLDTNDKHDPKCPWGMIQEYFKNGS